MAFQTRNNNQQKEYQTTMDTKYNSTEDNEVRLSLFYFGQKIGIKLSPPLPENEKSDSSRFYSSPESTVSIYLNPSEARVFVNLAKKLLKGDTIKVSKKKKTVENEMNNVYLINSGNSAAMVLYKIETGFSLELREFSSKNADSITARMYYDFDVQEIASGYNIEDETNNGYQYAPENSDFNLFIEQMEYMSSIGYELHQTSRSAIYFTNRVGNKLETLDGKFDTLFNGRTGNRASQGRDSYEKNTNRSASARFSRQTTNASSSKKGKSKNQEADDIDDIAETLDD